MKNILLLGMSTFPQILAVNRYSDPIERTYIFGYSQLEPTTKFLIDQMKKNGQKLDKIVIMASKDAKEKFYVEKEISYKASACEFYLARISEYIKNPMAQAQRDLQYYNEKTRNMESLFNECEIYLKDIVRKSDGDIEYCNVEGIEVVIVSMQEEKISFLYEVTKQIQDVEKVKLYLDMQGGSRNTIAQMNAIVGLLEGENVEIVGRYAIDFHKDNPVNPIREVSSEYNTYALISAMQAFKKYGRGQSLIEYFEGIDNVRVTELLNAIKKASDSIRLCDINGFDDALEQLSKIKDKKVESAQTEMDIVFEDIVDDYGDMLGNVRGGYLRKIEWCIRKGYIQQALTIVESKMPKYLYSNGIVEVKLNDKIVINNERKKIEYLLRHDRKTFKDISTEHIAVEDLFYRNYDKDKETKEIQKINDVKYLLSFYKNKEIKPIYLEKYQVEITCQIKPDCIKYLPAFMRLHSYLKLQRNNVNHSSETYRLPRIEVLEQKLKMYVEIGKMMIEE